MAVTVTVQTDTGASTYIGNIVCRGPETMEMLLTEPFGVAGRTVQFPVSSVIEMQKSGAPVPGSPALSRHP